MGAFEHKKNNAHQPKHQNNHKPKGGHGEGLGGHKKKSHKSSPSKFGKTIGKQAKHLAKDTAKLGKNLEKSTVSAGKAVGKGLEKIAKTPMDLLKGASNLVKYGAIAGGILVIIMISK